MRLGLHSVALALLVSRAATGDAPLALVAGPPGQEVALEADQLGYGIDSRVIRLEGHVAVRRGAATLRAARGVLDRKANTLRLEGGVMGLQGREVFLADAALVDLSLRTADLTNAVIFLKERTPDPANPRAGRNQLTLHGQRVHRVSPSALLAEQVTLTPCDCAGEPDFEIAARTALIEGDRAHLSGADLVLGGLAIPLFPLSLPLTNRQSGLLAPQVGGSSVTGFALAQPVFFTLGRSLDATVTPGYFVGGGNRPADGTAPLGGRNVRGPRLGLEARYAPVEGTRGSLSLDLLYDLDKGASPAAAVPGEPDTGAGRGFGGVRGVGHLAHRTEGALGTFAVQGTFASDSMVVADVDPLPLDRSLDVLRTDLGAWHESGPLTLGADATMLQDVRAPDPAHPDRRLFGPERRHTFQRLPGAFAQLAPVALGPFTASAEASAAAFAPFGARDALERDTGFAPTDRGGFAAPLAPGPDYGRAPALRLDAAPRLTAALPSDLPFVLALDAGARADAWLLQGGGRQRAYLTAGARASVDLERRYGDRLHVLTPDLRVRAISASVQRGGPPIGDPADAGGAGYAANAGAAEQGLGRDPSLGIDGVPAARRPYDDLDGAAPSGGAVEATLGLSQSLWTRTGGLPARTLRLDLLQDLLLWSGGGRARVGEAAALASVALGTAVLNTQLRFDWPTRQVSSLGAWLGGLRDPRGDDLRFGLSLLRGASSERLRAGADELFSAAQLALAAPGSLAGTASAGITAALPLLRNGLRASYDVTRYLFVGGGRNYLEDWDHRLALAYETPCRCATVGLADLIRVKDGKILGWSQFSFVLDLKSLGSFASF